MKNPARTGRAKFGMLSGAGEPHLINSHYEDYTMSDESKQQPALKLSEGQYKVLRHFIREESVRGDAWDGIARSLQYYDTPYDLIEQLHIRRLGGNQHTAWVVWMPSDLAKRSVALYIAEHEVQ
jgi:hypothetical protein